MVALYILIKQTINITSLTHKFLVKGHTQNLCDNAHSVIEQNVSRPLKEGPTPPVYYGDEDCYENWKPPIDPMDLDLFFDIKQHLELEF